MTKQRVAIYARYSTDRQDKSSIKGQVTNCRKRAKDLGFNVVKTFKDEGLSGTDLTRPGFLKLVEGLEAGEYDGILVDETSRLARNSHTLGRLAEDCAFRNQFIMDCNHYDSRSEMSHIFAAIEQAMNTMELKKIARRTHRGITERTKKGCSGGSVAYGYTRPTIDPKTGDKERRQWHKHEVDPETSKVVIEIFEKYADGMSPRAIAASLNEQGIPSPAAHWNRRLDSGKPTNGLWRASSIHHMLTNEIYRGELVWNKTTWKKVPRTRKRMQEPRPEAEWKRKAVPHARIVSDRLWNKVQKRRREVYEKSINIRKALGGMGPGRRAKHLLSGLLKCESCGASFVIRDGRSYMCASQCNGAKKACDNTVSFKKADAEKIVCEAVATKLLTDKAIDKALTAAVKKAYDEQVTLKSDANSARKLENRLATIEKQMGNLADAIAVSGFSSALQKKHEALETEHAEITRKLAAASGSKKALPKQQAAAREALIRLRQMIEDMPNAYAAMGTPEGKAKAKAALERFLGAVPINPAGRAILRPLGQQAYIGGSGGRI